MNYELIAVWQNGRETLVSWSRSLATITERCARYNAQACMGVVYEVRANG